MSNTITVIPFYPLSGKTPDGIDINNISVGSQLISLANGLIRGTTINAIAGEVYRKLPGNIYLLLSKASTSILIPRKSLIALLTANNINVTPDYSVDIANIYSIIDMILTGGLPPVTSP